MGNRRGEYGSSLLRRLLLLRLLWIQFYAELRAKLANRIIVELSPVPLLEHREGRLLAADLLRQYALAQPGFTPGLPYLSADFWIEICHGE